ncbi:MAG: NAD(P)H-binding protein [Alphaproteobacteria bacterium]|nr:NAD(P)H-binding protein [Alphaproteobacteria bacterium]MCB9698459.1 NAD(P)H-binding protein [Alphaproteobacteria bacterium]
MRVLVLGATGGVGRELVTQAVERGHEVTALVRGEASLPPAVRVIRAGVLAPGALADAVRERPTVLSALGQRRAHPFPWSPLRSPPDLGARWARLLVDAARDLGRLRVVAVSAAGVGDSAPQMNVVMRGLVATSTIGVAYRDLAEMERILLGADLDVTCVRPVTLTNGPRTGRVQEVDAFGLTASISRADVAAWMLDAAAHPGREPRTPQIATRTDGGT